MLTTEEQENALKTLLKSHADPTPEDVRTLSRALSPSAASSVSSLALLCLSRIVDTSNAKGGDAAEQAERLKKTFNSLVGDAVGQGSDDPAALVPAVSLLAALSPLAPQAVVEIITQPLGLGGSGDDEVEIDPLAVLLEFAELPSTLQPALAALLSALAGTKAGRGVVRARALEWITAAADTTSRLEGDTRVLCAVALSKLGREGPKVGEPEEDRLARDEESRAHETKLAHTLMRHIISASSAAESPTASDVSALLPTLEGLSVLSTLGPIRDVLASKSVFIKSLLSLSPVPKPKGGSLPVTPRSSMGSLGEEALAPVDAALCFGIATILANLVARKPVLSEHDQQMERLRRMAISGKTAAEAEDEDPHERDEAVDRRVKLLMHAGVVPSLAGLARAESPRVREALGRISLGLVEDKMERPVFVRDGGFKVLTLVLRDLGKNGNPLPAAQALAKLVISTPPQMLFPPPYQVNALNALSPLYLLLVHPSSTLLQQFEALMALTNLASIDGSIGARIVAAKVALPEDGELKGRGRATGPTSVLSRVEELLLDDNTLVRRAATELVCNLVSSESGFKHFAGEETQGGGGAAARLGVLLLLSDVDDLPTRLAASGALAILTESETACAALVAGGGISGPTKRTVWDRVGSLFEPEDEKGDREDPTVITPTSPQLHLMHRGAVLVTNLLTYVDNLPEDLAAAEKKNIAESKLRDRVVAAAKSLADSKDENVLQVAMILAQANKLF